jgi:hypothetical protein
MSSAQGRFTSPDPSMNGVRLENPQTWNRYSYVLNNPPVLTDPTGEVWNSDCTWTDTCGVADDCIKTMAIANKNSVTVYGVNGPDDIATYGANDAGYVDVSKMASNSGANFQFQSGIDATFGSPRTAAGLFNATAVYGQEHPGDQKLSLNDIGSEDGTPIAPHATHDLGRSVDMSYMDANGKPVSAYRQGDVKHADDGRMIDLTNALKGNGFDQNYSAKPSMYGTQYAAGHGSHIHFGKTRSTLKPRTKRTAPQVSRKVKSNEQI